MGPLHSTRAPSEVLARLNSGNWTLAFTSLSSIPSSSAATSSRLNASSGAMVTAKSTSRTGRAAGTNRGTQATSIRTLPSCSAASAATVARRRSKTVGSSRS